MEDILLYFSLKYHGQFDLIYKALERKERVDESLKEELFKTIKADRIKFIDEICEKRPANKRFKKGWLNRINAIKYE